MSNNTDKIKNEMLIYEVDNKTVIDIQHLVQSQIATINNQAKIIIQDVLSTVSNKQFSMVLKRVYKYSSATDDWDFLYNAILERRNPARATRLVQQIYVYSLLKMCLVVPHPSGWGC